MNKVLNDIELKDSEPWGWYIMFAISSVAGYLLFKELIQIVFPDYNDGWIGAIIALGIMITLKLIDQYKFGNRWGMIMKNKREL